MNKSIGYRIIQNPDGSIYRGQYSGGKRSGYGHMKNSNNDEYNGLWKDDREDGEGVFKFGETGRIYRALY